MHNSPIQSVKKPGVMRRTAPTRMIVPSNKRSAGNLPSEISSLIALIVPEPCVFARYAPPKPVITMIAIVRQKPISGASLIKIMSSINGTNVKIRKRIKTDCFRIKLLGFQIALFRSDKKRQRYEHCIAQHQQYRTEGLCRIDDHKTDDYSCNCHCKENLIYLSKRKSFYILFYFFCHENSL